MGDFKRRVVWQKSFDLVDALYQTSRRLPRDELFGLTSQLRRAAVSISANIAEGAGRFGLRDQARCYRIAFASAKEVECLLLLACRLRFLGADEGDRIIPSVQEVQRMLASLIRRVVRESGG